MLNETAKAPKVNLLLNQKCTRINITAGMKEDFNLTRVAELFQEEDPYERLADE